MSHSWLLGVVDVDLNKAMAAMKLAGRFTPDDVHKAFRRRVMETKCHPDHGGDAALFKRLTAARDLLLKSFTKPPATFGIKHKQGPMGVANNNQRLIDRILFLMRSCGTLDEAIAEVEKLRG